MELWDLYTQDRQPTGLTMVRGSEHPQGYYRLVVHVCIFNSKGQMLIQQRQPFKEGWPNMWDVSVGGSVVAGESSREAAEREAAEELGLRISLEGVRPAITISFKEGFDDNYVVVRDVKDEEITLQPEEVQAYKWVDEAEILQMIEDGLFIPYHKGKIELLFFLRNHMGSHTK